MLSVIVVELQEERGLGVLGVVNLEICTSSKYSTLISGIGIRLLILLNKKSFWEYL